MVNQKIRDRYAALLGLSQRTLPSGGAINKVSALLVKWFQPAYDVTDAGRKAIIRDLPLPADHEGDTIPAAIGEQRQFKIDDLMAQSTPVRKVPDQLRLRSADLPKVLKGDGGEKNTEGLAWIVLMLGGLYVPDANERPAPDEGEEPDELPEAVKDDFAPEPAG